MLDWGADRQSLKIIYCALIRSTLDYGSMIYGTASASLLDKVNKIQNQTLRLCCGAFKTSPVTALQVEMNEMPLEFHRLKLKLVYWATVKWHSEIHPVKKVLENCWEHEYVNLNSFGWKANNEAHQIGISNCDVCNTVVLPVTPPWFFPMPVVDFQILVSINDKNRQESKVSIVHKYLDQKYISVTHIYTDGSKDPETGHSSSNICPKVQV